MKVKWDPFESTVEEDDFVEIPVSADTAKRLDECRQQKPDGTKETDDELVTRLLRAQNH